MSVEGKREINKGYKLRGWHGCIKERILIFPNRNHKIHFGAYKYFFPRAGSGYFSGEVLFPVRYIYL